MLAQLCHDIVKDNLDRFSHLPLLSESGLGSSCKGILLLDRDFLYCTV